MRKIILSIVALLLICCFIFIGIKSDGFTNFDKVFDSVYDQVNKYIKPTAYTLEDTTYKQSNKYPIYSESKTIVESQLYSDNGSFTSLLNNKNLKNEDFMYYIHIDSNANNYEFFPLTIMFNTLFFRFEVADTWMSDSYTMSLKYLEYDDDMNEICKFEYSKIVQLNSSIFDYYLVITPKSIKFCYYDFNSTFPSNNNNKIENALNFIIAEINSGTEEYNLIFDIFNCLNTDYYYESTLSDYGKIDNFKISEHYSVFSELPTREGYTFKGFYYDEAFTKPYTGIPVKPIEELYQKWEINTYQVIFDCRTEEDPNLDLIEITYNYGEQIDYVPVRAGYDFIGWINDATNQDYVAGQVTEDLYLRAKWNTHKLKITYLDEDESFLYEQLIEIGGHATYIPKKVGFKFAGWKDFNDLPIFDEETTLVATWVAAECVVTLYINNNVFKAYKVGYGQSLESFLSGIGIKQKYIAKYAYLDMTGSNIPINEIELEKDMRIDISESYLRNQELIESVNANKSLIVIGASALIGLIILSIIISIFGGKKHKKKR